MLKKTQKGSALLTALFIITLVAIVATAMSTRLKLDINRIGMVNNSDQLHLADQAVTFWAMERLMDPKQRLQNVNAIGKVLTYPKTLQLVPNIKLSGYLVDLQARFNLNNLSDTQYQPIFFGLLSELNIGSASFERKNILDAILNWLQPLQSNATHDEWSDKYARQTPPYLPGHMPMRNISELRLVYGISAKRYQKLEPYVTVLPETAGININTASKVLLSSLGDGIKDDDLNHILNERQQKPYKDINALVAVLEKYHIQAETVVVESHYFLVVAQAEQADITIRVYTVLKRNKDKTGLWHVSIVSQAVNTM